MYCSSLRISGWRCGDRFIEHVISKAMARCA